MASFQYISSTYNNNNNCHQRNIIPQDLIKIIPTCASVEPNILASNNMGKGHSRRKLLAPNLDNENEDNYKKKKMHREIERQRRKEMAALHAGLRSLIPLEYIKGKRSMADHMNGAVSYIKRLQTRISELGARRDDLIKNSNSRTVGSASTSDCATSSCLAVHACPAGVEVVFSSNMEHGLPLSRVLQLLLEQGHATLSCVTTKVSDIRLLHTIQAEEHDYKYTVFY